MHDFYPSEDYVYLPLFYLEDDEEETSSDEVLYNSAEVNFDMGNYMDSQSEYKQVIEQYPESKFAKACIKQLFSVEEFVSNEYLSLKEYYKTNSTIINNLELEKLADFFANKCDIKLENWQFAIDWFENKIQNHESYADSLYTVIDLNNTYLLMQQAGYKSSYSGILTEHIPASQQQFEVKRDYLLSLIPGDKESKTLPESITGLGAGELMQNVPNPVKIHTQIWYKLANESKVTLNIFNSTGQLIYSLNEGVKSQGNHYIDFNAKNLKNGIYLYSININGQTADSKKMTIMK